MHSEWRTQYDYVYAVKEMKAGTIPWSAAQLGDPLTALTLNVPSQTV